MLAVALKLPAYAQVGKGLSGAHWNLNIIGVPRDKTIPKMTDSNRHVIFVPLQSGSDVSRQVKIYYVRGDDFRVLDGNATDDNEATIQVPYEFCGDLDTGCEELLSFDVYAVGLGKPNGTAVVQAECTYSIDTVPPDPGNSVGSNDVFCAQRAGGAFVCCCETRERAHRNFLPLWPARESS
jgi:hypothetical protein